MKRESEQGQTLRSLRVSLAYFAVNPGFYRKGREVEDAKSADGKRESGSVGWKFPEYLYRAFGLCPSICGKVLLFRRAAPKDLGARFGRRVLSEAEPPPEIDR